MNFNFFASLFNKQPKKSKQSILSCEIIDLLRRISQNNNFYFYKNLSITHENANILIPLLVFDPQRGIYLFECKEWSFDTLKLAKIKNSPHAPNANNTLAYDNMQDIIRKKYPEIKIFNFLLTQNLTFEEYDNLHSDIQTYLPYEKIIFSNSSQEEILSKLNDCTPIDNSMTQTNEILEKIFSQHLISNQQIKNIKFINSHPIATAMQLISTHSENNLNETIVCISNSLNKINLEEDLKFFIKENAHVVLSDYEVLSTKKADITILLDIDEVDEQQLQGALNIGKNLIYIIYESKCDKITNLKKYFKEKK